MKVFDRDGTIRELSVAEILSMLKLERVENARRKGKSEKDRLVEAGQMLLPFKRRGNELRTLNLEGAH